MVPKWSRYGIRCFAGFWFSHSYICPATGGLLCKAEAVDKQQQAARRNIPVDAKISVWTLFCYWIRKRHWWISGMKNADELQALWKRLTTGDADILEVHKIRWSVWTCRREVAQNSAAHRTALQSCLAMNGNMPWSLLKHVSPPYRNNDLQCYEDEGMASDLDLQTAATTARCRREAGFGRPPRMVAEAGSRLSP